MKIAIFLGVIGCALLSVQPALAGVVFNFQGIVDLKNNQLELNLKPVQAGSISVKAAKVSDDSYNFSFDFEHVQTSRLDFSSQIQSTFQIVKEPNRMDNVIRGSVKSQYSLINLKPVHELSGQFEIKDNRLHLMDISFNDLTGNGFVDLLPPYKMDMSLYLAAVNLPDFMNFWVKDFEDSSSGAVSGEIKIAGDLIKPYLKGSLESFNGFVGKLEFDSFYLNIEGAYPLMKIAHSTVSRTNGMSFTFEGPLNLMNRGNFKKQLQALDISPLVSNTPSSRAWTIKRTNSDDTGTTEIKYILRKNNEASSPTREEESDMLGVQRTMQF